jgi:hypothetical protein
MDSQSQGDTETNRICVSEEQFPYVNSVITLQNYITKYCS